MLFVLDFLAVVGKKKRVVVVVARLFTIVRVVVKEKSLMVA